MSTAFNSVSRADSLWANQGATLPSSQPASTDAGTPQFSALLSKFVPPSSPAPAAAAGLNSSQQEQDKLISSNQARAQETERSLSQRAESQRQENNRQALKSSDGSANENGSQNVSNNGAQAQSNASASKLNLQGRLAFAARPANAAADADQPNPSTDGSPAASAQARAAKAPSSDASDKGAAGTATRSDKTAADTATLATPAAAAQQAATASANATTPLTANASLAANAQADGATDAAGTTPAPGATAKRGSLGAQGRADLHGKPGNQALTAQTGASATTNTSTDSNAAVAEGKDKSAASFAAQLQSAGQAPDPTANSTGQAAGQMAGQGADALSAAAGKPNGLTAGVLAATQTPQALADTSPNNAASSANISLPQPLHSAAFVPEMAARLSVLASQGVQEAHLHLNPAEMGPVAVQIVVDGQQAQISFHADNAQTREVLERGLPDLAAALRDSGLTLSGGGVFQQMNQQSQTGQNQTSDGQRSGMGGVRQADRSILSMNDSGMSAAARPVARATQGVVDLYA